MNPPQNEAERAALVCQLFAALLNVEEAGDRLSHTKRFSRELKRDLNLLRANAAKFNERYLKLFGAAEVDTVNAYGNLIREAGTLLCSVPAENATAAVETLREWVDGGAEYEKRPYLLAS